MNTQPARRLAAVALLLGGVFLAELLIAPHGARDLRDELAGLGAWGPLVATAAYVLLTCMMAPGPVLAGACGLLFGTVLGTAVAIESATLGASAAFLIGRRLAQRPFAAIAGARLRDWTQRIEQRGFLAVLYARIAPAVPFALLSYAAGLTRIGLRDFAAASALGASPRAFAYAALGGNLGNYSSPEALVAIGVLVLMALGGGALLWHARLKRPPH
ncbi:MAG: TVP38/TMEM64 family protein [Solirubrobacteraceae bacterium]